MSSEVRADRLDRYGAIAVRIALNLQPGQRLLVIGPLMNGGVSLDAAPLVRRIAASAYEAGAPLVEVIWGDEPLQLARFEHAGPGTFGECSTWLPRALIEHVEAGHAVLSVYANDPDLLQHQTTDHVAALQHAVSVAVSPFRDLISRNRTNWAVVAAAGPAWADKVYPEAPAERRLDMLSEAIDRFCRLDRPDPLKAWEDHLAALAGRAGALNASRYTALHFTGPGTDLTVGLPRNHIWVSGASTTTSGVRFVANLPTEEVFTIADRNRVDGVVRATKPLSHGGTLIDDFTVWFEQGRAVRVSAARGESVLRKLIETDASAGRLGEVALVADDSPIASAGRLFYSTLFDENAASHVAFGTAYKFTLAGADAMSDAEFEQAGGNRSAVHVDFMIGSAAMDVDGLREGGGAEPLMRKGKWCQS